MSRTLVTGSEEDFDHICDPCNYENLRIEAKGYCLNCNEHLCVSCINIHKKMSALRDHVIKKDGRASKSQITDTRKPVPDSDPLTDKCLKHPEEVIKFYCNTHHKLACGVCVPLDHKNCDDVSYIRDVSGGIADSEELKGVLTQLRQVAALLKFTKSKVNTNKELLNERYELTLVEIISFKEEIVDYLNELVNDLRRRASALKDGAVEDTAKQTSVCEELLQETEKMMSELDNRDKMGLNNGLFATMKRAKANLPSLQKKTDSICNKTNAQRFVFRRDEKINILTSSFKSIGELTLTNEPRGFKYLHEIRVSPEDNPSSCHIGGMSMMSDGGVALVDADNCVVKIIDVEQRNVSDKLATPSSPLDLTVLQDDKIAVTLNGKRYIPVLSTKPSLALHHKIAVQHKYDSIACKSDKLFLTPHPSEKDSTIHICDFGGTLLQNIDIGLADTVYPQLVVGRNSDIMYAINHQSHAFVCFNETGTVISIYTSDDLAVPTGIAIDDDGLVYVCAGGSSTVHQLTSSGRSGKVILTEKQGVKVPAAMVYAAGRLYISSMSNDPNIAKHIQVFEQV